MTAQADARAENSLFCSGGQEAGGRRAKNSLSAAAGMKKAIRLSGPRSYQKSLIISAEKLQFYDVGSLSSAIALDQIIRNCLTLFQGFEAFALNSGEMNENVLSVLTCDKAITFFSVEPLNCTLVH